MVKSPSTGKIPKPPEEPKRLPPKTEVLRKLYLYSGNCCAMADCDFPIMDQSGALIGHICHIEAALPDGPRFNYVMTNEERRSFENLVLLCANHHAEIDSPAYQSHWTAKKLQKLKVAHIAKVDQIVLKMRDAFVAQFEDITAAIILALPSHLSNSKPSTDTPLIRTTPSVQGSRLKTTPTDCHRRPLKPAISLSR